MPSININIDAAYAQPVFTAFSKRLEEIKSTMLSLTNEATEIEKILSTLSAQATFDVVDEDTDKKDDNQEFEDGYKTKWGWSAKSQFLLKKYGPSSTSQVADIVVRKYQPDLKKETVIKSLSSALGTDVKNGKLKRDKNDFSEFIYSVIE